MRRLEESNAFWRGVRTTAMWFGGIILGLSAVVTSIATAYQAFFK